MNVKEVKELALKFSSEELNKFADDFEATGSAAVKTSEDPDEQMSDYLQAAELRGLLDKGLNMSDAIREFSKRIREVLS